MADPVTAQTKATEEKQLEGDSATETALAKVMGMLEKIDDRVTQIETCTGSSVFGSAPQSPALPVSRPHASTTIGQASSDFGAGLTLNELGGSGFGVKSVVKERAERGKVGRDSIYKYTSDSKRHDQDFEVDGQQVFGRRARIQSQFTWGERLGVNKLGEYLKPNSVAATFFQVNVWTWWATSPTLYYVLDQMYQAFKITINHQQAAVLFAKEKEKSRSWNLHLLYLIALCHESGSHEHLIVENIVKYAVPHLKIPIMVRYQPSRTVYITHAQELVAWAQEIEDNTKAAKRMDIELLYDVECCEDERSLLLPDGGFLEVTKRGSITLQGYARGQPTQIVLTDVYYAPKLARNIIFMGKLMERECLLTKNGGKLVMTAKGKAVFDARIDSGVLVADLVSEPKQMSTVRLQQIVMTAVAEVASSKEVQKGSLHQFHLRLGHLAYDTIERMAKDPDYNIELSDHVRANCLTCAEGKGTRTAQPQKDSGTNAPTDRIGGVICSDLKGPITPTDRRGNRYLVVFVDYKSSYVRVFTARKKNVAAKMFEHFLAWFEREFNCRIHVLRTDGGGEYRVVDMFCKELGVRRQVTEPNTPQSNGKAERMNRTIFNMVRCMIFGSGLPLTYWSEAAEYAAYILNRSPTRSNPKRMSPIEVLTGYAPSLLGIVVFGSPCMVWRDPKKKALTQHAERAIIIGKSEETKGYKVILVKDKVVKTTRHVSNIETLDNTANEQILRALEDDQEDVVERLAQACAHNAAQNQKDVKDREAKETQARKSQSKFTVKSSEQREPKRTGLRRSNRYRKKSKKKAEADELVTRNDTATTTKGKASTRTVKTKTMKKQNFNQNVVVTEKPPLMAFAVLPASKAIIKRSTVTDPANYRAARRGPDSGRWAEAEQEELRSLEANKTWEVVKRTSNVKPLPTKWVYKTKLKADGSVERYKARLVARGDKQVYGENYFLTFSTVIPIGNAFVILSFSRMWGVPARHGDVPSAYPKAHTEPEYNIYLMIPAGMAISQDVLDQHGVQDARELALLLKRSLYGLKQAGRLWHELLRDTLLRMDFVQCVSEPCIFYKLDESGMTLVGTYVDDLLVTGTSVERIDKFFLDMAVLELKDLGVVEKFLGMRISWSKEGGFQIDQEQTINELLERHGLKDANPVRVPIADEAETNEYSEPLPVKSTATPRQPTVKDFQSLVGSLLWVSRCTRPDIAFAVHKATRHAHAPSVQDYKLAKKISRYLKGTKSLKLRLCEDLEPAWPVRIVSYSDADFAADKIDRKSISAGVLTVNGMTVGWYCRKQSAVAQSTAEAEFVAAAIGGREALGLKELYEELGQRVKTPVVLKIDNQAAVKQIENETSSASIKHVDVKLKFLRDYARKKIVKPEYESTKTMVADLLTKVLPAPRMMELRELIGLE